jgi:hypothetical protein
MENHTFYQTTLPVLKLRADKPTAIANLEINASEGQQALRFDNA